jgi:hypothetical protein
VDDAILDSELLATDETSRPQYDLFRRTRRPSYVAFDLVPICALCPSASAGGAREAFCRKNPAKWGRRLTSEPD